MSKYYIYRYNDTYKRTFIFMRTGTTNTMVHDFDQPNQYPKGHKWEVPKNYDEFVTELKEWEIVKYKLLYG